MAKDPRDTMTPEERAHEMWKIHPKELDELMGFPNSREDFYLAHINAAILQAVTDGAQPNVKRMADALKSARKAIVNADVEVVTDTLWASPIETVVDCIDAALHVTPGAKFRRAKFRRA